MRGWKANDNIDFDFHDAHDLNVLRDGSSEETVKRKLRERLAYTKQAIVLVGPYTKSHHKYVRWEIECCLDMGIPVVVANLNERRGLDDNLCPPILKGRPVVHVPFKLKIIKHALDDFCPNHHLHRDKTDMYYPDVVYKGLGI